MATRDIRDIDDRADPGHKAVGYCCVLLAGCYVAAVILLVGYLIALIFR